MGTKNYILMLNGITVSKMGRSNNPAWGPWFSTKTGRNRITGVITTYPDNQTLYSNDLYSVCLSELSSNGREGALHLSIHRIDRKAIHDWRHLQRIKNELVGAEREAIEIYPPESHLFDGANEYHLWVLATGDTTPFTAKEGRQVTNTPSVPGAVQRYSEDYEKSL